MDWILPSSSFHGIPRQEYWSGLPFPPPEDLSNPEIEHMLPAARALQTNSTTEPPWKLLEDTVPSVIILFAFFFFFYQMELKFSFHIKTYTWTFIAALFTTDKTWKSSFIFAFIVYVLCHNQEIFAKTNVKSPFPSIVQWV